MRGVPAIPEATFAFRVDDELKARFGKLARAHDRTGAQLPRDFMRSYVEREEQAGGHDAWFRREVQIGLEAANARDTISAEAWRRKTRRKIAKAS